MPVSILDTADFINFGSPTHLDDINPKTIMLWANIASAGHHGSVGVLAEKYNGSNLGWYFYTLASGTDDLILIQTFTGNDSLWSADDAMSFDSTWRHYAVTYDNSATTNNPLMYINGVSQVVTEYTTPTGAADTDAAQNLIIGGNAAGTWGADAVIDDFRIYDSILTQAQIAEIVAKKTYRLDAPLPIFRPKLLGAAGIQDYNGASLGAANKAIDDIQGVLGTPSGNPTGVDGTLLAY